MANDPLEKAQADLDTIRQAAGMSLPFGREDIIFGLLLAAATCILAFWSLIEIGPGLLAAGAVFVLLAAGGFIWLRIRFRRGTGWPAPRRTEYSVSLVGNVLLLAGLLAFLYWSRIAGIQRQYIYAAVCWSLGLACLLTGLGDRARRRYLSAALGLVAIGIVIPVFWRGPVVFAVAAAAVAAVLLDTGIMAWQLRSARADV